MFLLKHILKIVWLILFVSGCSGVEQVQPTPTLDLPRRVPQIPSGFAWKFLPEENLAVVIPDGWYFKQETVSESKFKIYVTKENIEETGEFTTGLTVLIYSNFKNEEEAQQFENLLIQNLLSEESREKVWINLDRDSGSMIVHQLRIRGDYPQETEVDSKEIVHYGGVVANMLVYWVIFVSPEDLWDRAFEDYAVVLNNIYIFCR